MPLFENLRIERSHGPTVLSRKPVVRLTGELADAQAFAAAWPELLARLEAAIAAVGVQDLPGPLRELQTDAVARGLFGQLPRGIEPDSAVGEIGRLLAAAAVSLLAAARAPRGEWGVVKASPPRFLAYWDDWMEGAGLFAARGAVALLEAAYAGPDSALEKTAVTALTEIRGKRLDAFSYPLVREAELRGVPWRRLFGDGIVLVYGQGRRQRLARSTTSDAQSHASVTITLRKDLTSDLLAQAGFPVPEQRRVNSRAAAAAAAEALGYPLVVKPVAGSRAENTTLWLDSAEKVAAAYAACGPDGTEVLVERQAMGEPFRITVLGGDAVAAGRHKVPFVVGDGTATLDQLIAAHDAHAQLPVPDSYGRYYPYDRAYYAEQLARRLEEQGLTLDSVPQAGREVMLGYVPQRDRGGLYVEVTDSIHPGLMRMAEDIAAVIGSPNLGIDIITTDIASPPGAAPLVVNEVNSSPIPYSHEQVAQPRNVAPFALKTLIPEAGLDETGAQGRIPLALFYEFSDPALFDILERLLTAAGWTPGIADPDAARIAGYALRPFTGRSAHPGVSVLRDRRADAGVFAVDEGDLTRRGMPSDHADVVAFPSGLSTRAQHSLRQGMSCLAGLPGRLLLTAPGEMPEWLRKAAAHRRWIAVAAPEDSMQPPPEGAEILCCETGPRGELRALLCGEGSRDLLCDRLDEDRAAAQLWALAALLGFGFAPGEIRRLALRCRPADPGSEPAGTISAGVFETQGARRA